MADSALTQLKAQLKKYATQVKTLASFLKKAPTALEEQEQLKDSIRAQTDEIMAAFKAAPQDRAQRLAFEGLRKEYTGKQVASKNTRRE